MKNVSNGVKANMRRLILMLCLIYSPLEVRSDDGFELASGLTIKLIADNDLVPDCTCIAVDTRGRILASGPGYLKRLHDDDGDQILDRGVTLTSNPSRGAHGICVDGNSIYYVGDSGVWRLEDREGDPVATTPPKKMLTVKTGGEHDAHALRIGPDGYWYLIVGNGGERMFSLQNKENASVPNPRAGVIWRISPDWSEREIWAHGFRNAYDFDFGPNQSIVTFDSDGERDVSLPWYRPTRVYQVQAGKDAGWVSRSWKRPNCDPQMPLVLAQFGRGSPTGVLRSRHSRLPKRFREGSFVLDWTFGRVLFVNDQGDSELVAQAKGNTGFAVTDIDAMPDGRLIVSVGGRRSRGGIYLIDSLEPSSDQSERKLEWSAPVRPRQGELIRYILRLRSTTMRDIDPKAATLAINTLSNPASDRNQQIEAATLLIESVGGLGPGDPKDARGEAQAAPVFDSCRSVLRPQLPPQLIAQATETLIPLIRESLDDPEWNDELIRALAVIEPDSKAAFDCVMKNLGQVASPVKKLHRLIALARLPTKRSDVMTEQIVEAMLQIPRMVEASELKVDRNWTPRLGELFVALQHRDSLLPSRLVANPEFGQPADLVWTVQMDPENLERARQKLLRGSRGPLKDPRIARFIARGDDAVPSDVVRSWLADPATRPSGWLAVASHARQSDVPLLKKAAVSVDAEASKAASAALNRLGEAVPDRITNAESIQQWLSRSKRISEIEAEPLRGKTWFQQRKCESCHNGATALGPSLEGIRKRFNTEDLLRATVDPSHTIPDRYRARQVVTTDGKTFLGMPIYESVDGVTLMTVESEMKRVNADEIAIIQDAAVSMMPEGLLEGMSDLEVAQLLAYLQSL